MKSLLLGNIKMGITFKSLEPLVQWVELVYLWEVPWFIPGFSNPPAKYLRKALVRLPFGMAASGCLKDYKYNVTLWATDNIEFNLIHVCALTWCPKNVGHQTHASFFLSCFKEAGGVEVI